MDDEFCVRTNFKKKDQLCWLTREYEELPKFMIGR